jgi:hypothetical protein
MHGSLPPSHLLISVYTPPLTHVYSNNNKKLALCKFLMRVTKCIMFRRTRKWERERGRVKGSAVNRPSSFALLCPSVSVCGVVTLSIPSVHHLLAALSHFGGVYV